MNLLLFGNTGCLSTLLQTSELDILTAYEKVEVELLSWFWEGACPPPPQGESIQLEIDSGPKSIGDTQALMEQINIIHIHLEPGWGRCGWMLSDCVYGLGAHSSDDIAFKLPVV